jgi:hypothetical protein
MSAGVGICMMESSEYSPVFMASNLFHINNVKTDCSNHTIKTINITKKGDSIMSRILIETNSGKVFGTRKQVQERRIRTQEEIEEARKQDAFVKVCASYGLPPEFYRTGLLYNEGFYYLTGLFGADAEITSLTGITTTVSFKEVVDGIKSECEKELEELAPMMEMLYDSISDCKVRTSVRQEIVNRQRCAEKALDVCCFQMKELLENMGLPKEAYCAGWKTDRSDAHVYEFVSYRPENGNEKPFILEDICKQSSDPTRFKAVSYENLKKGLLTYAAEAARNAEDPETIAEATKMYYMLDRMCEPSVDIISINVEGSNVKKVKRCTGQLMLPF